MGHIGPGVVGGGAAARCRYMEGAGEPLGERRATANACQACKPRPVRGEMAPQGWHGHECNEEEDRGQVPDNAPVHFVGGAGKAKRRQSALRLEDNQTPPRGAACRRRGPPAAIRCQYAFWSLAPLPRNRAACRAGAPARAARVVSIVRGHEGVDAVGLPGDGLSSKGSATIRGGGRRWHARAHRRRLGHGVLSQCCRKSVSIDRRAAMVQVCWALSMRMSWVPSAKAQHTIIILPQLL